MCVSRSEVMARSWGAFLAMLGEAKVINSEERDVMTNKKIWFITGASRGMGVDFAKAALAAGHAVVASGRNRARVSKALGQSNDLLAVKLDVTSRADAEAAGAGRCRPVRPHRRAGQQCGQLLRGLLRGADAGGDGAVLPQ
jgi:hypothetical protein